MRTQLLCLFVLLTIGLATCAHSMESRADRFTKKWRIGTTWTVKFRSTVMNRGRIESESVSRCRFYVMSIPDRTVQEFTLLIAWELGDCAYVVLDPVDLSILRWGRLGKDTGKAAWDRATDPSPAWLQDTVGAEKTPHDLGFLAAITGPAGLHAITFPPFLNFREVWWNKGTEGFLLRNFVDPAGGIKLGLAIGKDYAQAKDRADQERYHMLYIWEPGDVWWRSISFNTGGSKIPDVIELEN